jgi:hypothetical protein
MWLFTELGFYSIVKKGAVWHLRGREWQDLENVATRLPGNPEVQDSFPGSDYPFRLLLNGKQKAAFFKLIEGTVEYGNFKSRVAEMPDQQHKLPALHDVWETMRIR